MELYRLYDNVKYRFGGTFPKSRKFIQDYKWAIDKSNGKTKVQVIDGQVTFWNRW